MLYSNSRTMPNKQAKLRKNLPAMSQQKTDKKYSLSPFSWWAMGEILLIVAVFYLAAVQPPPGVNEPHYLARLRHAVDPSFCPGDLFLNSLDAHKTFVVAFAWLTHFLSFGAIAWIGRLLNWLFLAWAWRRLSWTVVPKIGFAALAAALMVSATAKGNLSGEWLIKGFEAKTIAYGFVLLGLRAWVLKNWNWTWIHLGIASAWHVLVGGWSVVILLALWLSGWRREQSLVVMLPGLVLGGFISLAGVLPALELSASQPPEVRSEAAVIYVFERLPHHLAPLHKPVQWITHKAGRHAVIVTLFAALLWGRRAALGGGWAALRDDPAGRIAHYAIGALALAMIGFGIELTLWDDPPRAALLLRYYWFRLTDIAVPWALALLWIRLLADLLHGAARRATAMLVVMLLAAGVPLAPQFRDYLHRPVAAADAQASDVADWLNVCDWIKQNTPEDALFLTPRSTSSFKWHAQRAELVTYKDVPQDAESLIAWRNRLYDVFKPQGDPTKRWVRSTSQLGTPRILELAEKYRFDFLLTKHHNPLNLPKRYANEHYVVYEIPSPENNPYKTP